MNNDNEEKRRKILKAAAAFPMIATIPSGSAMANASTNQCIVSAKEDLINRGEESMGVLMPTQLQGNEWELPTPDEYLRMSVPVGELKERGNASFKVFPAYKIGEKYVDNSGNEYSGDALMFKQASNAYVAVVFQHNENMSDAHFIGLWPDEGLYNENIALTGSCWTSISNGEIVKNGIV